MLSKSTIDLLANTFSVTQKPNHFKHRYTFLAQLEAFHEEPSKNTKNATWGKVLTPLISSPETTTYILKRFRVVLFSLYTTVP